ncbi:ATP-binding protein [Streptomyces sp. NPDC008141]|uniref:ATP-binding protein n=1 Tax=Streptomyces sp. NPDC008141 TaxID=3364815 RepID=UPI0036E404C4
MTFRSRRLEELLGGTLDAVTYADIAALAGNPDAAEAEDLDYKQAHCTSEAKSREELAKDVAAFANHVGGVIIIGMAEHRGVPSKVFDVDLDDARLRELQPPCAGTTCSRRTRQPRDRVPAYPCRAVRRHPTPSPRRR